MTNHRPSSRNYDERLFVANWLKKVPFFTTMPNSILVDLSFKLSSKSFKEHETSKIR